MIESAIIEQTGIGEDGASTAVPAPAWNTWREWGRLWSYAFIAYTGFVVLGATSNALNTVRDGLTVNWTDLIGHRVLEEYTCAVFVPPLFWLVHRYPIDRRHWRRSIPILLAASVLFVIIKYVAVYLPLIGIVFPGDTLTLSNALALYMVQVLSDFWGVIGVAHAIEFYRRAQERERVSAQLRVQLSQAQLQALRSQLHPHFLFNTLNGIATLMHRDVQAADRMVTDLADLLRATLKHPGAHEISLRDELTLLERYLAIVSVRFRDRLTVRYEIASDACDALVPQFLLQPLAENAIEHGIARRPGSGVVVVRATRTSDQLCITVCDDGPGLGVGTPAGHGIGLANTRARLRELYGTAHALRLEPASTDGGVRVTVILPYHRQAPVAAPATPHQPMLVAV